MTDAIKKGHPIIFAGAGPGDPELITVKAQRAMMKADRVIYAGSLVPEELLKWTRPGCEHIDSAPLHLEEIVELMVKGFLDQKRVVRLHTGDPSLYGAIFEQMAMLDEQKVPYEVIPGVTAAFAAAAAMKKEYTLPEVSQSLILTRMAGRTPVPETESLKSLAAHRTSMAIYLSLSMVERVQEILCAAYGHDSPCAVAFRVSYPDEEIFMTTAEKLAQEVKKRNIKKQALIITGPFLSVDRENLKFKSRLYDKSFSHGFREKKR